MPGEGALQNGLSQPLGAFQVDSDFGFDFLHDGQPPLCFRDYALLFGKRRKRNRRDDAR